MQSRNEDILQGIIDGTDVSEYPAPQSRVEALLLQILDKINSGGTSGYSIWVGTAEEYAALAPNYDPDTIYFVRE